MIRPASVEHRIFTHQGFGPKGKDSLVVECVCSTTPLGETRGDAKTRREAADQLAIAHQRKNT